MKSSEIARLAGCTVRTLRHYHAIGLLPEPPRGENGYRDYGAEDLARLLRVKRLASLGFSLDRIGEVLEEMDASPADAAGAGASEALDELDRKLAAQIERLEEQRRTIALLKAERLDPDLPVRFAEAAKVLLAAKNPTGNERLALVITGHLYNEDETCELERAAKAFEERGLIERMAETQARFDALPADAKHEEVDLVVADVIKLLDPIMDCFDPVNWEEPEDADTWDFLEELASKDLNPMQRYANDRIMEELEARILARQGGE